MRSTLVSFITAALLLCLAPPVLGINGAIVGSKHDLSSFHDPSSFNERVWTPGMEGMTYIDFGEICVYCHTPHHEGTYAPLWNRTASTPTSYPMYGYPMYGSETIDIPLSDSPNDVSLACLSCHDGTLALDRIIHAPGPGGIVSGGSVYPYGQPPGGYPNYVTLSLDLHYRLSANGDQACGSCHAGGKSHNQPHPYITQDRRDDHPVSINYPTSQGDPDFYSPDQLNGRQGFDKDGNGWIGSDEIRLFDGKVECPSCHNQHSPDEDDLEGRAPFLRAPKRGSGFCKTCHKK